MCVRMCARAQKGAQRESFQGSGDRGGAAAGEVLSLSALHEEAAVEEGDPLGSSYKLLLWVYFFVLFCF